MTNTNITRTETDNEITLDRALDLHDEKGRKVGGYAIVGKKTRCGWTGQDRDPNKVLGYPVTINASRDGRSFGALPRETYHPTIAAALAHAERGLAAQGKRYTKLYGAAKVCPVCADAACETKSKACGK